MANRGEDQGYVPTRFHRGPMRRGWVCRRPYGDVELVNRWTRVARMVYRTYRTRLVRKEAPSWRWYVVVIDVHEYVVVERLTIKGGYNSPNAARAWTFLTSVVVGGFRQRYRDRDVHLTTS